MFFALLLSFLKNSLKIQLKKAIFLILGIFSVLEMRVMPIFCAQVPLFPTCPWHVLGAVISNTSLGYVLNAFFEGEGIFPMRRKGLRMKDHWLCNGRMNHQKGDDAAIS